MNNIAGKAVAFNLAFTSEFAAYMKSSLSLAKFMTRALEKRGYRIVSGGTDCHLFVIDLTNLAINGRAAEALLEKIGILVSRSAIPFDPQKPLITSGIRLGTLAAAARGFTEELALESIDILDIALRNPEDEHIQSKLHHRTKDIALSLRSMLS
jgi:glycine hydroxymethyltransferase